MLARQTPGGESRPVPIGSRLIGVRLRPAIPRRVAPQQSPPPLHQSAIIVAEPAHTHQMRGSTSSLPPGVSSLLCTPGDISILRRQAITRAPYPKQAVLKALRTDPTNAMSFLALMAHQVIELRQPLEVIKVRSAKEPVLVYLDLNSDPDGRTVNLRSQLQDIASELGLSREAFYRTLASLERDGAIERAGSHILLKRSVAV